MDCKEFSTKHAAFLDDTLPGYLMAAMREHLADCTRCARRDAEVRRSLLILKNLPQIHVSEGFQHRLRERISAEGPSAHTASTSGGGLSRWGVAAAALVAVLGVTSWRNQDAVVELPVRLPAVIAVAPLLDAHLTGDEAAPAYVASMSTGIPMWPALMMAEEGPLRFAGQNASWDNAKPQD